MQKLVNLLVVAALVCSSGCGKKKSESEPPEQVLNLTVLIDMSDRTADSGQVSRDTALISAIADRFAKVVRDHEFADSKDRLQILLLPQAGNRPDMLTPSIDVGRLNQQNKIVVREMPQLVGKIKHDVAAMYQRKTQYQGADAWSFFRDYAKNYIAKAPANAPEVYYNKMIILTDGYLNFADNIQKQRPANSYMHVGELLKEPDWHQRYQTLKLESVGDFKQQLDVLLLEFAPRRAATQVHTKDILETYWKEWLTAMHTNVPDAHLNSEPLQTVEVSIDEFLQLPQPPAAKSE